MKEWNPTQNLQSNTVARRTNLKKSDEFWCEYMYTPSFQTLIGQSSPVGLTVRWIWQTLLTCLKLIFLDFWPSKRSTTWSLSSSVNISCWIKLCSQFLGILAHFFVKMVGIWCWERAKIRPQFASIKSQR